MGSQRRHCDEPQGRPCQSQYADRDALAARGAWPLRARKRDGRARLRHRHRSGYAAAHERHGDRPAQRPALLDARYAQMPHGGNGALRLGQADARAGFDARRPLSDRPGGGGRDLHPLALAGEGAGHAEQRRFGARRGRNARSRHRHLHGDAASGRRCARSGAREGDGASGRHAAAPVTRLDRFGHDGQCRRLGHAGREGRARQGDRTGLHWPGRALCRCGRRGRARHRRQAGIAGKECEHHLRRAAGAQRACHAGCRRRLRSGRGGARTEGAVFSFSAVFAEAWSTRISGWCA